MRCVVRGVVMSVLAGFAGLSMPAFAADLVIGARTELAMDPHAQWLDTNTSYYNHIYGSLVRIDEKSAIVPDLAESWKTVSETEWQFKLRRDVKFHDGSALDAADIVASFGRARSLPTATSPYTGAIATVKEVKALDPHTISLVTTRPDPVLLHAIANIQIIPSELAGATTDSFNTGKSVVGTGPYRFVGFKAGDRLELARNPDYWGAKPKWDRVTFRFIPDDAARVAALLGNDVDLIDFVPPRLVERVKSAPNASLFLGPSDRPIFLIPDTERDVSPFIKDKDGRPLSKNPLKDKRVREALTVAIDRDLLTRRVMDGAAAPSSQPTAPGFGGYNESLQVPPFDAARAKKLLADAGYPDGFSMTVHCTNDRYVNDEKVCQAIGQMLARVGLKMSVEALPRSVFFPVATNHTSDARYSFMLLGWGNSSTGDAGLVPNMLHSLDRARGFGTWNLGHYSNSEIDKTIETAVSTMDLKQRYAGLAQAMKLAMEDHALIPLYTQSVIVAARKGLTYTTWANERTNAESVGGVKP
jgi:peptide/nickel transport system substrate-binding protein